MDNDGALLEALRNTYKGLRFRWKYRGLIILPAEQGNAAAADAIRAGQPFLFGRCGATEMRTVAEYLNENKGVLHKPLCFSASKDKVNVSIAMQYTDSYAENIVSFVNDVKTSDGGTHEVGFKTAITKVLNDYAKEKGFVKGKDKAFEGSGTNVCSEV